MRLRADEPEARNVENVYLDDKVVPMCHEASEEDGWVVSYMPDLPDNPPGNGEELVEEDESQQAGFRLIKRKGKVEIRFKANDTSVDN